MGDDNRTYRFMISGGGTGGHIYPAISIAQALKATLSNVEILFVGAEGRMEMKKVPEAGFKIEGLWISGIQRKITVDNLSLPFKVIASIRKSFRLIREFKPDVVIGVGGYASGPLLYAATRRNIPTLIQEQNSYAGLTNKWLAKRVDKICVAYDGLEKYFPKDKLVLTGNPVRLDIQQENKDAAFGYFNLDPNKKTILALGGSLGARTINQSIIKNLEALKASDVQLVWQTGGYYHQDIVEQLDRDDYPGIRIHDFIREMQYAYNVADLVISRAGALSIAELMIMSKATILVPSPNVAEDHQTLNAQALVGKDAAVMVKDNEAENELIPTALQVLEDKPRLEELKTQIAALAKPKAAYDIANEVIKMAL